MRKSTVISALRKQRERAKRLALELVAARRALRAAEFRGENLQRRLKAVVRVRLGRPAHYVDPKLQELSVMVDMELLEPMALQAEVLMQTAEALAERIRRTF